MEGRERTQTLRKRGDSLYTLLMYDESPFLMYMEMCSINFI